MVRDTTVHEEGYLHDLKQINWSLTNIRYFALVNHRSREQLSLAGGPHYNPARSGPTSSAQVAQVCGQLSFKCLQGRGCTTSLGPCGNA